MNNDLDPAESAGPAVPPVAVKRSRRLRVTELLNANALLATTALITAIEPKSPPYRGD